MSFPARKFFFVLQMAMVATSAYLAATATNTFLGAGLTSAEPEPYVDQGDPVAASQPPQRNFDATSSLFGPKKKTLPPERPGTPLNQTPKQMDGPIPTTLPLKLVGTAVYSDPSLSLASIVEIKKKDALLYSINACKNGANAVVTQTMGENRGIASWRIERPTPCNLMDGAIVLKIERSRVLIRNTQTGQTEYIDFKGGTNTTRPPVHMASMQETGIRSLGQNTYEVPQPLLDKYLGNMPSITKLVRVRPKFEDGAIGGYAVYSIRPGSPVSQLGLQNGDVIKGVNGYNLSNPDQLLTLYAKLKGEKQFSIDLMRRGRPQTMDYRIAN